MGRPQTRRDEEKSIYQSIRDSKTFEFILIKRLLSLLVGLIVGHVYYSVSFSQAFQNDEAYYSNIVKWIVISICAVGSLVSVQCCCIAALCIPTLAAKSGRKIIQAALFTWILAGPVSNIFYHSTEAIRSVTCVAKLQENQTKLLVELLTAPIVRGQASIVNESTALPEAQHDLESEMNGLRNELLTGIFGDKGPDDILDSGSRRKRNVNAGSSSSDSVKSKTAVEQQLEDIEEEYEAEEETVIRDEVDIAGNLRNERTEMCHEIYDKAYEECRRISDETWQACMSKIGIPIFNRIICGILYWVTEGKCTSKILDIKLRKCSTLSMDDNAINGNYSVVFNAVFNVEKEFKFGLYWEIPRIKEEAAVITVDEIAHAVRGEYVWRKIAMTMTISTVRKLLALLVLLVLRESAKYNSSYLTDITFDNFYVTPYFVRKDNERKRNNKRHLLPLTTLEKKHVMRPTALFLRARERRSLLLKTLTVTMQALVAIILFVFDEVLFFVMDLIAKHGRNDYRVTGIHKLEAKIGGNGTISHMMEMIFSGFQDNDHSVDISGSNAECLPVAKRLDASYVNMTWIGFATLIGLLLMEGYVLRARRLICSFFFPKREKGRIIRLYNEMLRQRKQKIQSVRKAILKLALTKSLNQKYGLLESLRVRFPKFGRFMAVFGVGKHRCLICETAESKQQKLWRCGNKRCRMMYCKICWLEIDEMCWACNSDGDDDSGASGGIFGAAHQKQQTGFSSDEDQPLLLNNQMA